MIVKPLIMQSLLAALLIVAFPFTVSAQDAAPAPAPAPAAEAAPAPPPPPPAVDIRQVQVKVWISEASEHGIRDIGANLNFSRFVRGEEQTGSIQQIITNTYNPADRFGTATLPYPNPTLFGNPLRPDMNNNLADGLQADRGAGLQFSIISTDAGTIDGVIQAMERRADVDLISKPELMVSNSLPATIKAGGQIPYQDVTYPLKAAPAYVTNFVSRNTPELQVAWKDVGVNLTLTPTIMPNEYVQLNITQLEVIDITRIDNLRGVDLPVFSSRAQTGIVYVPDGTTLVIGGLTSRAVRYSERRVPILGKLPLLGIPFRSRRSDAEVTSLLVFVSPTIVDLRAPTPQANSALSFWRERSAEWENRERIDREIEAMEQGM